MINAKTILDKLAALNEKELDESSQPSIGVFYFIDGDFYWDGEFPRLITGVEGGQKNFSRTHSRFFYQSVAHSDRSGKVLDVIKKYDTDRPKAWKYYPRGRVLCSEANTNFVVYCDKHVTENPRYRETVKDVMRLPFDTKFETDGEHYKCVKCKLADFM